MSIEMSAVESSQIAAIGHDPETNTLAIQFKNKGGPGATYHYDNVDVELFDRFRNADSKGTFFGKEIKADAKAYPFTRIAEPPKAERS